MAMTKDEALTVLLTWCEDTQIEFKAKGKREGSASYLRYENYAQAKTLGEAFEKYALPVADLLHDFQHGLLKATAGPYRAKPLSAEDLGLDPTKVCATDQALARLLKGKAFSAADAVAKELGMDVKDVRKSTGWCESSDMRARRMASEKKAGEVLAKLDATAAGKVTDEQVLRVLQEWPFRKNETRQYVAPDGMKIVLSDTFGCARSQTGQWAATYPTREYPSVSRLIISWLKASVGDDFPFTTVHINRDFATKRHREHNCEGPAAVRALGDFTGGRLMHWAKDDKVKALDDLPADGSTAIDVSGKFVEIDGNCAHEEEAFEGTRFSIVAFVCKKYEQAPADLIEDVAKVGVTIPTKEVMDAKCKALGITPGGGDRREAERSAKKGEKEAKKVAKKEDKKLAKPSEAKPSGGLNFAQKMKLAAAQKTQDEKKRKADEAPEGSETPSKKEKALKVTPKKEAKQAAKAAAKEAQDAGDAKKKERAEDAGDAAAGDADADADGSRKVACGLAREILQQAKKNKQKITTEDLLKVLRRWKFAENTTRKNVLPEGASFVHSDTLGCVSTITGDVLATRSSKDFPELMQICSQWLKDNQAKHLPDMKVAFPFTSINLNFGYGAKLHRDRNNKGPSLIIAMGNYEGGTLNYFPDDDKKLHLDKLPTEHSVELDLDNKLTLFDGNRGHSVNPFTGERFSIVFFTSGGYHRAKGEVQKQLKEAGATWPTPEACKSVESQMAKPKGYHVQDGVAFTKGSGPLDFMMGGGEAQKKKTPEQTPAAPPRKAETAKADKTTDGDGKAESGTKRKAPEPTQAQAHAAGDDDDQDEDIEKMEDDTPEVMSAPWRLAAFGAAASEDLASITYGLVGAAAAPSPSPSPPAGAEAGEEAANATAPPAGTDAGTKERCGWALFARTLEAMEAQPTCAGVSLTNMFRQLFHNGVEAELVTAVELLQSAEVVKSTTLSAAVESAFNLHLTSGQDLADAAVDGRKRQQTLRLVGSDRLTLGAVVAARDIADGEERKKGLTKLFAGSQGRDTWWLVRMLQGKVKFGRLAVLQALAHARLLARTQDAAEPVPALEDLMVHMEALGRASILAHGRAGGTAPLVKALLAGGADSLGALIDRVQRASAVTLNVAVSPMRAPTTFSKKRALNRLLASCGAQGPITVEPLYVGDRVQVHVKDGAVRVFGSDGKERVGDVLGAALTEALVGAVQAKELILDGVIKDNKATGAAKAGDEKEKEEAEPPSTNILDRLAGVTESDLDPEIAALEALLRAKKRQRRAGATSGGPTLAVFDLLFVDGELLTGHCLRIRRERLRKVLLVAPGSLPQLSLARGQDFEAASAIEVRNITGLIKDAVGSGLAIGVVMKGLDTPYEAGRRSGAWQVSEEYGAAKELHKAAA